MGNKLSDSPLIWAFPRLSPLPFRCCYTGLQIFFSNFEKNFPNPFGSRPGDLQQALGRFLGAPQKILAFYVQLP